MAQATFSSISVYQAISKKLWHSFSHPRGSGGPQDYANFALS